MTDYPLAQKQEYGPHSSSSYASSVQYAPTQRSYAPSQTSYKITNLRKGRCPTNGKCTVCSRLCMMD